MMDPVAPLSWGELLDKITILQIKAERLTAADALAHVADELAQLSAIAAEGDRIDPTIAGLQGALKAINETLWDIEDRIREKEARQEFDGEFIALARSVYQTNDRRAAVKREINRYLKSALVEEKQYAPYQSGERASPA